MANRYLVKQGSKNHNKLLDKIFFIHDVGLDSDNFLEGNTDELTD